jgi:hypothetical protein
MVITDEHDKALQSILEASSVLLNDVPVRVHLNGTMLEVMDGVNTKSIDFSDTSYLMYAGGDMVILTYPDGSDIDLEFKLTLPYKIDLRQHPLITTV